MPGYFRWFLRNRKAAQLFPATEQEQSQPAHGRQRQRGWFGDRPRRTALTIEAADSRSADILFRRILTLDITNVKRGGAGALPVQKQPVIRRAQWIHV